MFTFGIIMYLCALMKEPPFNHIDSTSSGSTFPRILAHNLTIAISHFWRTGRKTEQGERRAEPISALRSPTCPPQIHRDPPHIPLIYRQGNIHAAPRRSIPRRVAPLEECFPCVSGNNFSVHSPCSSFAIVLTGEGGEGYPRGGGLGGVVFRLLIPKAGIVPRGGHGDPRGGRRKRRRRRSRRSRRSRRRRRRTPSSSFLILFLLLL